MLFMQFLSFVTQGFRLKPAELTSKGVNSLMLQITLFLMVFSIDKLL